MCPDLGKEFLVDLLNNGLTVLYNLDKSGHLRPNLEGEIVLRFN